MNERLGEVPIAIAESLRRCKELVGDVDLLVARPSPKSLGAQPASRWQME